MLFAVPRENTQTNIQMALLGKGIVAGETGDCDYSGTV